MKKQKPNNLDQKMKAYHDKPVEEKIWKSGWTYASPVYNEKAFPLWLQILTAICFTCAAYGIFA